MTNSSTPDGVDTRIVFRIYAALAAMTGLLLLGPPPPWLSTSLAATPMMRFVIFRLVAAALLAAACFALGFARIEDPRTRHRALLWFAVGHAVACAIVFMQVTALGGDDPQDLALPVLLVVTLTLFYFWQTGDGFRTGQFLEPTRLFQAETPEQLRSRYEEQIREAASQEERNRLARELHDSIKQQIFAMQTAAATAEARFDSDPDGAKEAIARLRDSGREAMSEMEAMLDNLRAAPLENVGLVEALKKQAEAVGFRTAAQVECEVGDLPPNEALPPGAQQAIFRVAQEALANVGRHARAAHVRVRLGTWDGQVGLEVRDDGQGFERNGVERGMGLRNMRTRAAEVRGSVAIESAPGRGTTVRLVVPVTGTIARDISDYRRRLMYWAVAFGVTVVMAMFAGGPGGSRPMLVLPFFNAVVLIRVVVAYLRARRLRSRSSWIASPSHS